MSFFVKAGSFLRNLFFSRRVEADLDQEVRSHLEMLVEQNTSAGMSSAEALRAARIELGGIAQVKEQVREQRIGNWLQSVISDCRYGARQFRKNPGFTAVAVLTLALGIGSATAIFSIIDGALLHPYPYKNAERLATFTVYSADQFRAWRFPAPAFVDFRQQNHSFEDMFGLVYRRIHFTRNNAANELRGGCSVTPGTFESLGVAPLFGRPLNAGDAGPGSPPVFVISYRLWTDFFHRDKNIVGVTYTLNSTPMTLVGIMPPRFQIGGCDIWLPLNITRDTFVPGAGIQSNEIWTVGHLKPGINPETASADLQLIATPLQNDDPLYFPPHFRIVVNTLNSQALGHEFKLGLFALMAAVTMLLVIACSNVANLLFARATMREAEFGIRSALGASRFRLIRQLLVESIFLALASCALGCVVAFFALKILVAVIPVDTIPPEAAIALSPSALLFSLAVTSVTAVFCGLAPAFHALRVHPQTALIGAGKGIGAGSRHGKLRSSLVIAEVALSIVLFICSGLILRSLIALHNVNLGFNASNVVYAQISWPEAQYDSAQQKHALLRRVLDRLAHFPGVTAAAETSSFPPYTYTWTTVAIQGKEPPQNRNTAAIMCTERYFQILERPLLRGSLLTQNDIDSARRVVVVNHTFVHDNFGDDDPIGRRVRLKDFETLADWPRDPYFEIIGVVADGKNDGLQDLPRPEIYLPATLTGDGEHDLMVSAAANPYGILQQVRKEISTSGADVVVGEAGTISDLLQRSYYARPRFLFITFCSFAAIALLLVAAGIFSVISYVVALQTPQIGIRMAIGARPIQVLGFFLQQGLQLIFAGIGLGLVAAYFLARLLASQIWGVSAADPSTFTAVGLLTLVVGVLACLLPAYRAARVDPALALRYE